MTEVLVSEIKPDVAANEALGILGEVGLTFPQALKATAEIRRIATSGDGVIHVNLGRNPGESTRLWLLENRVTHGK